MLNASNPSADTGITPARRTTMLAVLMMIYTVNFVDRTILATLGQAIKLDLLITDAQLGLLQGLAFAAFYTTLGIPLARLSERVNRVSLIAICLAVWSGMTALCGAAQNFVQLFLCRIGVGIGEAGCSPPAHSLISDMYAPRKRATALAIYSFGIPLGTMVGAVSGGWLVEHFNWRVALVVVGLPGIALALVFRLLAREPVRGAMDAAATTVATEAPPSIRETIAHLFGNRAFLHITIGATLVGFVGYGTGTFAYAYFIRMFHMGYAELGLVYGLVGGLSAGLGTLLGGWMSDWAGKRRRSWYALLPAIGLLIAAPTYIVAFTRGEWITAMWWMLLPGLFHYAYIGPTLGVMHNLALPRMRATATALFFVVVNLVGLGIGPYATGALIDYAANRRFSASGLGDFATQCPGGVAAPGAADSLQSACTGAMAQGTQDGIVIMLLVFLWAALHYLIAARHMGWLKREAVASPAPARQPG
ncbi:spinster family MFS transporter [Lysobacter niastensis]|uniref:MFS transporter n=1 Tax=Lysobacter niastensis TaxID=380629 RepID=A0ABS0B578_9GAMM|nr:MFS transporter [Lysobacter niastensis]MBF6023951.1 MFS transporter [Lysobacter niastensis]